MHVGRTALDRELKSRRMLAAASALMIPPIHEPMAEEGTALPPVIVPPSPAARASGLAKSLSQRMLSALSPRRQPPPPASSRFASGGGQDGNAAGPLGSNVEEDPSGWEYEDEPSAEASLAAAQQASCAASGGAPVRLPVRFTSGGIGGTSIGKLHPGEPRSDNHVILEVPEEEDQCPVSSVFGVVLNPVCVPEVWIKLAGNG